LDDVKKLNFLQNIGKVAHLQENVRKFNHIVTRNNLVCVFNNLNIPASVAIKRFMDVVLQNRITY